MEPQQPRDVTHEGGSTQITLKNAGCARVASAIFLAVWLFGWGVGEIISLRVLLQFLGYEAELPFPVPVDNLRPKETAIAIVAVWCLFWTWIGIASIVNMLRTLFGRDVIELATGEWRVTRFIGPFGTTRTFVPSEGWSAMLRDSQKLLTARRAGKTVVASRLGTIAERAWVRDEIAKRYPPTRTDSAVPVGYVARFGETGGLIITPERGSRRRVFGCGVFPTLLWNVPLWWWLAVESKAYIPIWPIVIGVVLALFTIWILFARSSWHVAPNLYEHRVGMFGYTHTTRITNATLSYELSRDSDGDIWYRLFARDATGRKRQIKASMNAPEETKEWGEMVARETGWKENPSPEGGLPRPAADRRE